MHKTRAAALLGMLVVLVGGCAPSPATLEPATPYAADLPVPASFTEVVGSKVNQVSGQYRYVDITWKGSAPHRQTVDFMMKQMTEAGWSEQQVWRSPTESRIHYTRTGQPSETCLVKIWTVEQSWPDPVQTYVNLQVDPVLEDK